MGLIYCLTFPNNKKYIGLTTRTFESRFMAHKNAAYYKNSKDTSLYRAIRKYGIQNIKTEILADNIFDLELLGLLEIEFISKYLNDGYKLYNISSGGLIPSLGRKFTKKQIEARSKQSKRIWSDPEYKAVMSKKFSEKWLDQEYRQKTQKALNESRRKPKFRNAISESQKGSKNNQAKLTEEKVLIILKMLKEKVMIKDIIQQFGVSRTTIQNIRNFKIWKHVSRD